MARPRLGEEERRGRTVGVRVTEAEAEELQERAQGARLSVGAYLRRRGLGQRVRMAAERSLGAAELRELNRIGVNLNQMARAMNSGAVSTPAGDPGGGGASGGTRGCACLAGESRVMVTKMSARRGARSVGWRITACTIRWVPGLPHPPESAKRVEWTETRNLATEQGDRAARIMAATAEASPELKRLAGAAATGRKLEKPVCHYSLNWAKDEKPDRQEMSRAVQESLKALGMERHQALIVSHRDGQPHVHVIANRVEPESGKAAGLSRSKLRLSKWAERYEREQGKIRCPARERNNKRREAGERVVDGHGHSGGRWQSGADESAAGAAGSDPGTAGRTGAGASGLAVGGRSACTGSGFSSGGGRISGNWRGGASGSGRSFTGVKSGSGSSWLKTAMECWGASGLGGSWAASCERSAGRSGDARKYWGAFGRSWRPGNAGSGSRLGKRIRKRCVRSRAWREKATAAIWKGQRDGRVRRRGGTPSQCMTVTVAETGTGSSARRRRSGWSRCGSSTESKLTRR